MKKWIKIIIGIVVVIAIIKIIAVVTLGDNSPQIRKPSIAVMDIKGQIMDSTKTIKTLEKLKDNPLVKGVIVRVNSPGGAVTPSMEMYDYILNLGKPVYVAMGSLAASGGYLISLAGDSIYAEPTTLTGSIGVIMNSVTTEDLMEKIGIKSVVVKSGEYKDAGNPLREMTVGDREVLTEMVMDIYYQFTDLVVERRGLEKERVLELADGRIYTGKKAHELGLINHLGSWRKATEDMKESLQNRELEIYEVPTEKSFLERLSEASTQTAIGKILFQKTGIFYLSEIY